MTAPDLAWVAVVVLLATTVQGALGFGATLVVVSLAALRVPIGELLPVLVPVSCLATGTLFVVERAHVDRALLVRRILPLMAPGVVLGAVFAARLADDTARRCYGLLVVLLAVQALWVLRRSRRTAPATAPAPSSAGTGWIVLAGVMHGVYATGGPLLVYAVDRVGLTPRAFRATLAGVWLTLNVLLTASFAAQGRLDASTAACSVALVPALGLGLLLGHRVHVALEARTLRTLVLGLLVMAGTSLMGR